MDDLGRGRPVAPPSGGLRAEFEGARKKPSAAEFSTRCCGEPHQGALLAAHGKLNTNSPTPRADISTSMNRRTFLTHCDNLRDFHRYAVRGRKAPTSILEERSLSRSFVERADHRWSRSGRAGTSEFFHSATIPERRSGTARGRMGAHWPAGASIATLRDPLLGVVRRAASPFGTVSTGTGLRVRRASGDGGARLRSLGMGCFPRQLAMSETFESAVASATEGGATQLLVRQVSILLDTVLHAAYRGVMHRTMRGRAAACPDEEAWSLHHRWTLEDIRCPCISTAAPSVDTASSGWNRLRSTVAIAPPVLSASATRSNPCSAPSSRRPRARADGVSRAEQRVRGLSSGAEAVPAL
jgi:hypothetical protein